MKPYILILAIILCGWARVMGQDTKAKPVKPNILIEMQIVAIPRELAVPLVRDLMDKDRIEPAYLRIQELLESKTAKLIGWPMVTTQSEQRAVIYSIEEFRYATEYLPGATDFYTFDDKGPGGGTVTKLPDHIDEVQFNGVPTAFETRDTGVTLEVEPVLSPDEKTINITIVPQHIRLNRMNKCVVEKEKTHEKIVVEQPQFDTMKITTTLTLKSGERILMGVYPTAEFPDHLELFILHSEVRKLQ